MKLHIHNVRSIGAKARNVAGVNWATLTIGSDEGEVEIALFFDTALAAVDLAAAINGLSSFDDKVEAA